MARSPMAFATSVPDDAGRSSRATDAPTAMSRSDVARPSPEAPPVTTALTVRGSIEPPGSHSSRSCPFPTEPHYLVRCWLESPTSAVLPDTNHLISFPGMSVAPIRGEITEIVGRPSSGRTSYLLACLGDVVSQGETAALVD